MSKENLKKGGKQADGTVIYTYPLCTTCCKHHKGGAAECLINSYLAKELWDANLNASIQCIQQQHLKLLADKCSAKTKGTPAAMDCSLTAAETSLAAVGILQILELNENNTTLAQCSKSLSTLLPRNCFSGPYFHEK
jgi:hypothetical protein